MREHLKEFIDGSSSKGVRGLRILLEYSYATEVFEKIQKKGIHLASVFGSARAPKDSELYQTAVKLGEMLYRAGFGVVTGASQGVMEAANEGVSRGIVKEIAAQKKITRVKALKDPSYKAKLSDYSTGLKISLPMEPNSNPFVGTLATFHYFMIRKFFFSSLSQGFIACEGGWGTRDELFEILTLVQTGKAPILPIVYLSKEPQHLIADLSYANRKGLVSDTEMHLLQIVTKPAEAVAILKKFYRVIDWIEYGRRRCVVLHLKRSVKGRTRKKVEAYLQKTSKRLDGIEWGLKQIKLKSYLPQCYGNLRVAIDLINQD